jgi:hypothetical protein
MSTPVTPNDFSEIRWRGHWIWTEPPAISSSPFTGPDDAKARAQAHGLFRKSFALEQVPECAPARITADSRYVLFVNGEEVFRGPVRSQPRRMHYDLFDLAPHLKVGENTIAVYVRYYGAANSYWIPAVANMALGKTGVLVFEANVFASRLDDAGWLVSDGSWKAMTSNAWSEPPAGRGPVGGGVPVEIFDAGSFADGWEQPGFDDSAWGNAAPVPAVHIGGFARTQPPTDPYGPLYPRPIARLEGETCMPASIQVETLQDPLDLSADSPAASIDKNVAAAVIGSEHPADDGHGPHRLRLPAVRGSGPRRHGARFCLRRGPDYWTVRRLWQKPGHALRGARGERLLPSLRLEWVTLHLCAGTRRGRRGDAQELLDQGEPLSVDRGCQL